MRAWLFRLFIGWWVIALVAVLLSPLLLMEILTYDGWDPHSSAYLHVVHRAAHEFWENP